VTKRGVRAWTKLFLKEGKRRNYFSSDSDAQVDSIPRLGRRWFPANYSARGQGIEVKNEYKAWRGGSQ
jgi:hypothetical protein